VPENDKFNHSENQDDHDPEDRGHEENGPEELVHDAGEEPAIRPMSPLMVVAGLLVSVYILIVSLVKADDVFFHSNDPDVAHNPNNLLWTPLAVVGIPVGVVLVALYLRRIWKMLHGDNVS
jgi:hypothetical protein